MSFSPKPTISVEYFSFDFSALLGSDETITAATVTLALLVGANSTSPLQSSGPPVIKGNVVSQMLMGGQEAAVYSVLCVIVTSEGQSLPLSGKLQIIATI